MSTVTVVQCPTCGKDVKWTKENKYRPFCSERCKKIDLGAWAEEKYTIPGSAPIDPFDDQSSQHN